MIRLIRSSDETISASDVGGKAAALARLVAAKLPVPEWLVVPAGAEPLSDAEAVELVQAARALAAPHSLFAVRSSAVEEDGAEHSFAGQLESFLAVRAEDIPSKVEAVRQSGRSERVLAYRRERGLTTPPRLPAVLVQRMLDPTAAGVAFSADPVTGRRGHAVVSAVFGVATSLVSGEADADTWVVDRGRTIVSRTPGRKATVHRIAENGLTAMPVIESERPQPALSDAQVIEVATLARAVETLFGRPQDIEWALAEGRIWLLQARPVTSLTTLADPDGGLNLWDNANIAESYSGVTTPLTFSFARGIYEAVYREFARLMGVSLRKLAANQDLFPRMLGLIEGRIYYNLISWYRLLALLPGFAVNRGFMEQMMGVKEGMPAEVLEKLTPASGWERFKDGFALARSCLGLVRNHLTLPRQIRRFYVRLDDALRPPTPPLEQMRPDEIAVYYRELEGKLLLRWDAPLVNDFFAMVFYGVLRKLTASWCGDPDGTLQNDLLCAEGGMISAEPAKRVREMAMKVAADPGAVRRLCEAPLAEISRWMEETDAFQGRYEAYLEKFGDRCLEELKLESRTLHEEPLTLLRSIGQYARRFGAQAWADEGGLERSLRAAAETRIREALRSRPLRRLIFGWVLKQARARVRDRENLRFERTRLFGRVRRICLEMGRRLQAAGALADARDVFYLTTDEMLGFVDGTAVTVRLRELTALRRDEFAAHRQKNPGDRFLTRGAVHLGNAFQPDKPVTRTSGAAIKGLGCCPGIVRARVRVVTEPRTDGIQPGEILVAPRTDPGWIMLFPSAAGLLVEHGSLLSHSAIVAREMGIPAIVSIAGVTSWLATGDWVEMDGTTGVVKKIGPEADAA